MQNGYLNGVLTNLSAKKGYPIKFCTNLSAKGLVQWSLDLSECKKGYLNEVLTNLSAKMFAAEF